MSAPTSRPYRPLLLTTAALFGLLAVATVWQPVPFLAAPTVVLGVFIAAHAIWPIR